MSSLANGLTGASFEASVCGGHVWKVRVEGAYGFGSPLLSKHAKGRSQPLEPERLFREEGAPGALTAGKKWGETALAGGKVKHETSLALQTARLSAPRPPGIN
jgi:hypothetical protein